MNTTNLGRITEVRKNSFTVSFEGEEYPAKLKGSFYEIDAGTQDSPLSILEKIGLQRGCLSRGAEVDTLRAAGLLLENFRNGKMGKVTLETPEE